MSFCFVTKHVFDGRTDGQTELRSQVSELERDVTLPHRRKT